MSKQLIEEKAGTYRRVLEVARRINAGEFMGERKRNLITKVENFYRAEQRYQEGEGDVIFGLRMLDDKADEIVKLATPPIKGKE